MTAKRSCSLLRASAILMGMFFFTTGHPAVTQAQPPTDTTLIIDLIEWGDRLDTLHVLRNTEVQLWEEDMSDLFPNEDDGPVSGVTDELSFVELHTPANDIPFDGSNELYVKIRASMPNVGNVVDVFGGDIHFVRVPDAGMNTVVPVNSTTHATIDFQAGSIASEAIAMLQTFEVIHDYYVGLGIGLTVPNVEVQFRPTTEAGAPGTFQTGTDRISVNHPVLGAAPGSEVDSDWGDVDVIYHEYGHLIAENNNMHAMPSLGLGHFAGEDQIDRHGDASVGTQLAWQEGIATFLGMLANRDGRLDLAIPGLPATDVDYFYDDYLYNAGGTKVTSTDTRYSIDDYFGGPAPQGEGDELSVSHILWDLFDRVMSIGDEEPYRHAGHEDRFDLSAASSVGRLRLDGDPDDGRLSDFWYDLQGIAGSTPLQLAQLGEVFEEYGVSAAAGSSAGGAIGDGGISLTPRPLLAWVEQNSGHSDLFRVLIFDEMLDQLLVDSGELTNLTNWLVPIDLPVGMYQWVVLSNSVLHNATDLFFDTFGNIRGGRSYWSGAASFLVIPEPATWALAAIALACVLCRTGRK